MQNPNKYGIVNRDRQQIRKDNLAATPPEKLSVGKPSGISVFVKEFDCTGKDKPGNRKCGQTGQGGKEHRTETPFGKGVNPLGEQVNQDDKHTHKEFKYRNLGDFSFHNKTLSGKELSLFYNSKPPLSIVTTVLQSNC